MRDLVLHQPTGLLIDFAADDFGGERQAEIIASWRQRRSVERGEFICYAHRAHERPWLYLQQRGNLLVAAHWPGTALADTHEIHHGISDEHKRQVEYITRAGASAGFDVRSEVRLPTNVRSDAVIYGPTTTGIEVQRSALSAAAAKARTTKARQAGVLPIWFSDAHRDPSWLFSVPGVRMNEQPWNTVPRAGSVTVVSGVRVIVPRRCRDIRNNSCPDRRRGCNKWHATHAPRLGTTVDDLAALVPAGEIVPILYKTLSGRKAYVLLVDRKDKARYEAMIGAAADLPLRQKERAMRGGVRIDCSADAGAPAAVCCGQRPPGAAGGPLVLACQLCPNSPTYWRRPLRAPASPIPRLREETR